MNANDLNDVLPMRVTILGRELKQAGRGKYPYDCISRDDHPNAMIYFGDGCWSHEFSSCFLERDKTKDVYGQKALKYIVIPGNVGTFYLFNTQDNVVLGGVDFRTVSEAFSACDGWNNVPPGGSAKSQQIIDVSGGVARATRLMTVAANLHELGRGIYEAISAGDRDLLKRRQEEYDKAGIEYIGLAAAGIVERYALSESLDKQFAAYDFAGNADPSSQAAHDAAKIMDDLERLAKEDFKTACALWDKHAPAGAPRPTFVDPAWRAQIEGLKTISNALNAALPATAVDEIYVTGEDYRLTVSLKDGRIVITDCYSDVARKFVAAIERFDVEEARDWVEQYSERESIAGDTFSIAAIGFWKKDGAYVAGEEDYRQDVEAENGSSRNMRP